MARDRVGGPAGIIGRVSTCGGRIVRAEGVGGMLGVRKSRADLRLARRLH